MTLVLPVKVNLYWDCFYPTGRMEEIIQTFKINLENPIFDQIICYYCKKNENNNYIPDTSSSPKIRLVEIRTPFPYFDDVFHLTNDLTGDYDINIIATNDIIYGNWNPELLNQYLRPDSFFCIARHELHEKWIDGQHALTNLPSHDPNIAGNTADVWIYRGKIPIFGGHFGKGSIWGGEEFLSQEAFRHGLFPSNPGLLFPVYHNHLIPIRANWPDAINKSKHFYNRKTGRGICPPYNPELVEVPPYPITQYFDFELPEYTPQLI